jgi:putative ABC transport system permease protein
VQSPLCIEEHRLKFLPLIWSGIWRKPGRSILIFLQVSVAFALFGVLQGMKTGVEQLIGQARADLLLVHGSLSFIERLPLGLLEQIKSVPGARVVVPVDLFGGAYQKPDQQLGIVAIRPDEGWLAAFTYTVAPEHAGAFKNTRTGALVREPLLAKYAWKIGDRIPLMTAIAKRRRKGLGIEWALVMGLLGGLLPALRAARMPVVTSLRAI